MKVEAFLATVIRIGGIEGQRPIFRRLVNPEHLPGHLVVLSGRVISGRGKVTPRENEKAREREGQRLAGPRSGYF